MCALPGANRGTGTAGPEDADAAERLRAEVARLSRRHRELLRRRAPWEGAWRSLAEHFLPTRFRLEAARGGEGDGQGPMLNSRLVDATGILAMRVLAAGLQGGLTSPARPWFRLSLDDADLAKSRQGQEWLDECADRMRVVLHRSNFYNVMHTLYAELGTFGTAFAFELADPRWGFSFVPLCAGEYALDCNERRRVDTVFRRVSMSLRQMAASFGAKALPEELRAILRRNPDQRFLVAQAVFPRAERQPGRADARGMAFASLHWLEGREGAHPLRVSGFRGFPGFGPRWDAAGNDVYGRSPAMDALPDCRMLQQMGITTLKAIHKAVDPPMSVAAGLRSVGLDLTPGAVNYVDSIPGQSPQAATPLVQVRPDLATARKAMEAVQNQIRAGLYNDLFKLVLEGRSQVTASEIAAREEEKLVLIGPVLERLHDELFLPLIDRTFELMRELDMLPPTPPELAGRRLRVEFVSLLAQAQKLVGTGAADRYMALAGRAAAVWPEALDCLNVDRLLDSYAETLGLPVSLTRPQEERDALRRERAGSAGREQALRLLGETTGVVERLAASPLTLPDGSRGSVLDALLELLGRAAGSGADAAGARAAMEAAAADTAGAAPGEVRP
ncbi:portal protein [uncultured Desulfovibrio sp.]|uniref:portal protein n=1 Tax=uncultured Desulfovibrio sp. TaxID=167968 RepID=UPI0026174EFD|nr:portal protein [uncultured Desulfovibrio sp.]